MRTNLIITDDFYGDPDAIREFALQQPYDVTGNFPGARTKSFLTPEVKETIQTIVWYSGGEITNWYSDHGYTGSFQLTYATDRSWIHTDHYNTWAGVLYLTPDAPLSSGTGIFQYKKTGATVASQLESYESQDMTKWELCDIIANRYNRLVLYRSEMFHTSLDYFGHDLQTGRLFQLFFITTQF